MKKLILLFILVAGIFSFNAGAQSLSILSEEGVVFAPDASIGYSGIPSDAEIVSLLKVKNNSANSLEVIFKKEIIDTIAGSLNSFCFGTGCYPPWIYVCPEIVAIGAGETNESFSGHYEPLENVGTSIVRYVFYVRDNPNDSVSVRVFYQAFPVGIEEVSAVTSISSIYPNPATDHFTVTYSVSGNNSRLVLRDMLGTVKLTSAVSGNGKKTFNSGSFISGIYFLSIETDGKIEATRKVVIK